MDNDMDSNMNNDASPTVSLTSTWFIRPGFEARVLAALGQLAQQVYALEPGTLVYRVHTPFVTDARLQSLPPVAPQSVVFFEEYRDADAFLAHVNGPSFLGFVEEYGAMFEPSNGHAFSTVNFLTRQAGFTRSGGTPAKAAMAAQAGNQHPSKMFEITARDQARAMAFYGKVFGWTFQRGSEGFAYVHFGSGPGASLGGIGQANPGVAGEAPGCHFYLTVGHLETAIDRAVAAGAGRLMDPTSLDGYRFAMITDLEGNIVGLLEG